MIMHEIVQNKGPGFFGERRFNAAPPIQLSEADRWQLAEQQLRQHGIIDTEERYHQCLISLYSDHYASLIMS